EIGGRVFVATSKTTQQRIFAETIRKLREAGAPVRSVVLVAKEKACLNDVVLCHPEACTYARDYHVKLETSGAVQRLTLLPGAEYYSPELPRPRVREVLRSLEHATDPLKKRIRGILRDLDAHLAEIESGAPPKPRTKPSEKNPEPARGAPNLLLFKDPQAEAA